MIPAKILIDLWKHVSSTLAHSERHKVDPNNSELERKYHQGKADALRIVALALQDSGAITPEQEAEWISVPRTGSVVGSYTCPVCHVGLNFLFQDMTKQRFECPVDGMWDFDWRNSWRT